MKFIYLLAMSCLVLPAVNAANTDSGHPGHDPVITTGKSPIMLKQVITRVLARNPALAIHGFENRAANARTRLSQLSVAPSIKLELDNFAGTGDYQDTNRLETTLSITQLLEATELRSSRYDLAQQQTLLLRNQQDSQRLDLLTQAAKQFIHVLVDQHQLKLAEDHLTLVQRTHNIVSKRVNTGRSHRAELRRLDIALAKAEIEQEHAEHELNSSRLKLSSYWGESRPGFSLVQAELFNLPALTPFEELKTLLLKNPDLVRYASEERVAQARLQLAQTKKLTNLEMSAGIRYLNDNSDTALMASISFPFGTRSRAQPHIDEMQAVLQSQPQKFEQQRLSLEVSLYALYQEAIHARTAYAVLQQRIIPAAQKAAADFQQGYQAGRFSLLELNEAQSSLLDAHHEAITTAANYHYLKIEIERLTGAVLQREELRGESS